MPLLKVWANFFTGEIPKWPPSAILESNFVMGLLTIMCSIWFLWFLGSENSFLTQFFYTIYTIYDSLQFTKSKNRSGLQKSLRGNATAAHRTNVMFVQPESYESKPDEEPAASLMKKKQISAKVKQNCAELTQFIQYFTARVSL